MFIHCDPKIQQTKMLDACQRFGDLLLFGLVWQYSTNHKTHNKGRFKVIATYRGSQLSTIFGIWKKSYYAKFVLVK